jgi:hypothetical protein
VVGKKGSRVNKVQKCAHMFVNAKAIPVETIPEIGEVGIKKNSRGGEFTYNKRNKF